MPYADAAIAAAEAPRALAAVYRACMARVPTQRPRFDALVEELERAAKAFCAGQRDGCSSTGQQPGASRPRHKPGAAPGDGPRPGRDRGPRAAGRKGPRAAPRPSRAH